MNGLNDRGNALALIVAVLVAAIQIAACVWTR
jgi:hypothetical protein